MLKSESLVSTDDRGFSELMDGDLEREIRISQREREREEREREREWRVSIYLVEGQRRNEARTNNKSNQYRVGQKSHPI